MKNQNLTEQQSVVYNYLLESSKNRVSKVSNAVICKEMAKASLNVRESYITLILQAIERKGKIKIESGYKKMASGRQRTITIL